MLRLIFNLFEKKFIKYLNKKNSIKLSVNNLAFAFHDLDGNGYYKFPKELDMPLERTAKVQEYLMWLVKGVSKEEYLNVLSEAENCLMEGLKNPKNTARLGFLITQLKERTKMVVHSELFYNIIAAQVIRADEPATSFNNEIHMQKVEAFKLMDKADDGFFLAIQEFLVPLGMSNITRENYVSLLIESKSLILALEEILKSLSESQ